MDKNTLKTLRNMDACKDAIAWLKTQPDTAPAWATCDRGDWMLWLLGRLSGDPGSDSRKRLVYVACQCARLVLPVFESQYPDDPRPRQAIETAERHARGDPSISLADVRRASYAAASAAYAADAYAAADAAAYAAAYAAASDAYAAAAGPKVLSQCADIVRQYYPEVPELQS